MNFGGCCPAVGAVAVGAGFQDGRNSGCVTGMNAPDAAVAVVDEAVVVEEELNRGDCHHHIVVDTAVGVVAAGGAQS